MDGLHVLVELGVLQSQGHELGDRFGGDDLLLAEPALDAVEKANQPDDLVACDQG